MPTRATEPSASTMSTALTTEAPAKERPPRAARKSEARASNVEAERPNRRLTSLNRFGAGRSDATSANKEAPAARRRARGEAEQPKRRTLIDTGRFDGVRRFSRDTWSEIKKVNWPDRETTRNLTLVVIAVSAVLGIMLGGIDFLLFQLFEILP